MAAANYNLIIDQGSDFIIRLTLSQGGAPVNLTTYSARAQLRNAKLATGSPVSNFTCNVVDPANGVITMQLLNAVNKTLTPGKFYYDLEIYTANDALVTRMMQGEVNLTPEVTR